MDSYKIGFTHYLNNGYLNLYLKILRWIMVFHQQQVVIPPVLISQCLKSHTNLIINNKTDLGTLI